MLSRNYLIQFLLLIMGSPVLAQPAVSYDSLSLEDLMNVKITVASIKELTPRQSPGIITYITAEDIRNLGARDLMEVLRHVPGFEFGVDVEGVVGLGVRGNWAHEGKVVLFIDGQEMNENLYSTLQFGNHYPVENIERIEIIRGPGSALHGGFAAYAVINIITRSPKNALETSATVYQGITADAPSRTAFNSYIGRKGENTSFSLKINASQAQRSHRNYSDIFGTTYDMTNQSDLNNIFINAGGKIGNFTVRYIYDRYIVQSRDEYVEAGLKAGDMEFTTHNTEVKYDLKLNDKLKIIPSVRFSHEVPWSSLKGNISSETSPFRIYTKTLTGALHSSYDFSEKTSLSLGASLDHQTAEKKIEGDVFETTGNAGFTNDNLAVYAQVFHKASWANIVGGVRYNYNVRFENPVVPRIGLTKEFKNLHLKALYSKAFRAPSIQNIDLSENIRPEFTDVYEFEAGFSITPDAYLTVNVFKIFTKDPIVYYVDSITDFDAYTNLSSTGSIGMDVVLQVKKKWGTFDFNTSYYHPTDEKDFSIYSIPQEEDMHLGLARCKTNAMLRINLSPYMQIGSNLNWLGTRYGITGLNENTGEPVYSKYKSQYLLNFFYEYRVKSVNGLTVRLSARNIFDQDEWFIQPYNSNHAALPGMGREFQIRITYQNF